MTLPDAPDPVVGSLNGSLIPRESPPAALRVEVPHTARMYDYWLGGKTNYPADRTAAEEILSIFPSARITAQQNRAFLHRAVRILAGEAAIDQFLDVGTGIPTPPNLHDVAQSVRPTARVVYVDNDPIVSTHARALLTSAPEGRTAYLEADLHQPKDILTSPVLAEILDLSRPVALSLVAVLHFLPDTMNPADLVAELADQLAPGSYLIISHGTADLAPDAAKRGTDIYKRSGIPLQLRSRAQVEALVPAGMDIIDPGIVLLHRWRPDTDPSMFADTDVSGYGLIAHKPRP
jgi:SAM-dependent methyltransferase